MKPIVRPLTPATKERINAAMTETARRYFKSGYNDGWRRGFRVGAPLGALAVSLLWGAGILIAWIVR